LGLLGQVKLGQVKLQKNLLHLRMTLLYFKSARKKSQQERVNWSHIRSVRAVTISAALCRQYLNYIGRIVRMIVE
jgi:hypothetical protein